MAGEVFKPGEALGSRVPAIHVLAAQQSAVVDARSARMTRFGKRRASDYLLPAAA